MGGYDSLGEEQRGQTVLAPSAFKCGLPQSLWSRWVLQPHPYGLRVSLWKDTN